MRLHDLADLVDKATQHSRMRSVHRNGLTHHHPDLPPTDPPIAPGQNRAAALDRHGYDRRASFDRQNKAASFERQEFLTRASSALGEEDHGDPFFDHLAGPSQTGHRLAPVRSIYNDVP